MKFGNTTARAATLAAGLACTALAFAQEPPPPPPDCGLIPYMTGFEDPPFTNGFLVGQDGWVVGATPGGQLSPNAAVITNAAARRSRQSVEVQGADLISSQPYTAPYEAVGSYRRPVECTMPEGKKLARVDADLMLETSEWKKTPGEFFSLTIAARSGDGETLGEVGLSSKGIVEAFPFDTQPGSRPEFKKPIYFNKWYHITMLLDFKRRTTSYFIDGEFLGAVLQCTQEEEDKKPKPCLLSTSNVLLRGAMVVYARPDGDKSGGPRSTRWDYTARFDNFRISVHDAATAPDIDH